MVDYAPTLDLSKYIETRLFEERPHIRGRRIPVSTIAYTARDNDHGVPELMYDFTLSESQVLSALLYYAEHQAEIDAQEEVYNAIPPEEWIKRGQDALLLRRNDAPPGGE